MQNLIEFLRTLVPFRKRTGIEDCKEIVEDVLKKADERRDEIDDLSAKSTILHFEVQKKIEQGTNGSIDSRSRLESARRSTHEHKVKEVDPDK